MNKSLLQIDVGAEIEKLALGRLRHRSQVPLALVKVLGRQGAATVRIQVGRRHLSLAHDGKGFALAVLEDLAILSDEARAVSDRHHALARIEKQQLLDLLVAFALRGCPLTMQNAPPVPAICQFTPGSGKLRWQAHHGQDGGKIQLGSWDRPKAETIQVLHEALRFAPFAVWVNGKRVDRELGLEDCFLQAESARYGMRALVGLPRTGMASRIRLVVDGVLDRELWHSPDNGAIFDAIVTQSSPDSNRRALDLVLQVADELDTVLRERFGQLSAFDQARARLLLYRRADAGQGAQAVAGAAMFVSLDGTLVSAEQMRQSAAKGIIQALGPRSRKEKFLLSAPVYVLDERDRAFCERHLGIHTREPDRRPRPDNLWRRWARLPGRWLGRAKAALAEIPFRPRPVPANALTPAETQLLAAANEALASACFSPALNTTVKFCSGRFGPTVRRQREGTELVLYLQRGKRRVRVLVEKFQKDPSSIYLALMMLGMDGAVVNRQYADAMQELLHLTQAQSGLTFPQTENGGE